MFKVKKYFKEVMYPPQYFTLNCLSMKYFLSNNSVFHNLYWKFCHFILINKLSHWYNFFYWQVLFFMEDFTQANVSAWVCTIFAHLIMGCAIWYPKIGNLRYMYGFEQHHIIIYMNSTCTQLNLNDIIHSVHK